jgi:hypothetical protein
LANYNFDKKFESNRKYELEKYLMRSKVDTEREKTLVSEIRRLEIVHIKIFSSLKNKKDNK